MSTDYVFDFETADSVATAVILSVALLPVDFDTEFDMASLRSACHYIKFDNRDQPNRTISKDTMRWWSEQDNAVRLAQFRSTPDALSLTAALTRFNDILEATGYNKHSVIWSRGTLDQIVYEHWAKSLVGSHGQPKIPCYRHRDIRTAVDLLYGANNGYVKISKPIGLIREHDPVDDCCRDAMMMKYGILNSGELTCDSRPNHLLPTRTPRLQS